MPNVTVTPIGRINVRVNPDNQKVVYGTSTFVGSDPNILQNVNTAISLATAALETANSKVSKTGDTMTGNLVFANSATISAIIDGGIFT